MICDECGTDSRHLRYRYNKAGVRVERGCDNCLLISRPVVPDVFYKDGETFNTNLWDKKSNRPYFYNSRSQKAAIMKKLNIVEAGDRQRGAR